MKNGKTILEASLCLVLLCSLILPAVVAEASDDYNRFPECDVGDWTDIIQVAAGDLHTVGLKSDGTVVAVGLETELAKWNLWVTDFEEVPPVNCQLIGGVIAVVIVGLAIFFVRRKRVA